MSLRKYFNPFYLMTTTHGFMVEQICLHKKDGQNTDSLPRLPESLEQLDLLLITVAKTRRVQQDGIRFQNFRYTDLNLSGFIGEDVIIRYDPRDLAEIRVYDTNNRFICRAICYELSGQNISLKEIIRTRNQRKKDLQSKLEERLNVVDKYINAHQAHSSSFNNPSLSQLNADDAIFPSGTEQITTP